MLAAASILEPGRPLAFVHPIVRTGIYTELSSGERSQGHRGAAQLFAAQPGANELVAEHLLVSDPAGDAWVVERLVEAARAATRSGAPESAAVYLRRALAEPPQPDAAAGAAARAGHGGGERRTARLAARSAGGGRVAPDEASGAAASMVLALALSRAQRPAEAVEVLDRALSGARRASCGARAPARGRGRRRGHERRRHGAHRGGAPPGLRERATRDLSAPPELLAVVGLHRRPHERAGRRRCPARAARARGGPARARSGRGAAVVLVRDVVLAGDRLADLGRALRRGAAAARRLDRRGARDRRQQPACRSVSHIAAGSRCDSATSAPPRPIRARRSPPPSCRRRRCTACSTAGCS